MPRTWRLKPIDVAALLVGNGLFIAAMWWRHGGLDQIPTPGGPFIAAGQLTALLGTYTALVQLVLMSRYALARPALRDASPGRLAPMDRLRDRVAPARPRCVNHHRVRGDRPHLADR